MTKVLVTGTSVDLSLLKPLENAGFDIDLKPGDLNEDQLIEALEGCQALLLGGDEYVSEKVMVNSPELKLISFLGVDYNWFVDTKAAEIHRIKIVNTPGQLTDSVAEFCVAQLISINRGIFTSTTMTDFSVAKSKQLTGTKIGIVGMGEVGSRVSQILHSAFNCEIYYTSRTQKPEVEKRDNAKFVDLITMLHTCDSILFSVSQNDESTSMFNWKMIEAIKDPISIVNISRPTTLDPMAVALGLQEGKISSITYDKFYDDNTPGASSIAEYSPERVIVTKHIGSLTHVARNAMAIKAVANIIDFLDQDQIGSNIAYRSSLG